MNTKQILKLLEESLHGSNYYLFSINEFNDKLYSFKLDGDLYFNLMDSLIKNNFELHRVKPIDQYTLNVMVKYLGDL